MDTNQNTANNYQINTFVKGMNSDTSYDMIGADQYLFGQNIRITNNTLLWGDLDSNNTEMVVAPVPAGKSFTSGVITQTDKILAVDSIENIGIVIVKNTTNNWEVYKATYSTNDVVFESIYVSQNEPKLPKFSTVMIKEVEKEDGESVIKVYIADGQGAPICLFVNGGFNVNDISEDYLRSNAYFPSSKPRLQKTSGNLKTQQVQYAYRFYTKYSYVSKLSPLTNKIHVIGTNRSIETGNAEDTVTDIGIKLTITPNELANEIFDKIQIFRISYIRPNQQPDIYLIADEYFTKNEQYSFIDNGTTDLQKYSLDEFSALQTYTLVPQVIESNQGYLFESNIKDETIIQENPHFTVIPRACEFSIKIDDSEYYDETLHKDLKPSVSNYTKTTDDNNLIGDYFYQCGIDYSGDVSYNEMFTSSLLRSLRYGEKYEYGIVYYDKHGRRTDVNQIKYNNSAHITVNSSMEDTGSLGFANRPFYNKGFANPYGVEFQISTENDWGDFVGFEIVRREKSYNHTKTLLQVALSRPSRQAKFANPSYRTPYYPNVLLSTNFVYYVSSRSQQINFSGDRVYELWTPTLSYGENVPYFDYGATNVENATLYQAFAPEINITQNDVLSQLSAGQIFLNPISYFIKNMQLSDIEQDGEDNAIDYATRSMVYDPSNPQKVIVPIDGDSPYQSTIPGLDTHEIQEGVYLFRKYELSPGYGGNEDSYSSEFKDVSEKVTRATIFKLDYKSQDFNNVSHPLITAVAQVKNPNWEDAFSSIQLGEDKMKVVSAVKQYKAYNTNIGDLEYNNWASTGMYDLAATESEAAAQPGQIGNSIPRKNYVYHIQEEDMSFNSRGWIGPGPVCMLLNIESPEIGSCLRQQIQPKFIGTIVANIEHPTIDYSPYDAYFGFGNYFELPKGQSMVTCKVFDGDVYQNFSEFVNLFKTYDFNDRKYTLQSGQVVYYIPTESKINVAFDYGMNYNNTGSANLTLEPGKIEGISSQNRPLHQYNLIYSDNDWSINSYTPIVEKELDSISYPQRICYSQLKTNGEPIDNWQIFRPADFIDTDSRYGEITELLSVDNNLYFWQTGAFGKLSVNERSLVTDNAGETIQLGQGGVLQRVDYLSTKYGIRKYDYCVTSTEDALYWIDILNKAILICRQNQVANYGEQLNVQNIINKYIYEDGLNIIPRIHYDLQTNELLCQCLKDEEGEKQLVFNTKYNIATSLYTRRYSDIILFNNVLVSLVKEGTNVFPNQLNYINTVSGYLNPTILQFVVNSSSSQTKVFDNQKVVTLNRNNWEEEEYKDGEDDVHMKSKTFLDKRGPYFTAYILSKEYEFSTDIRNTNNKPNAVTDREGNIVYDIPRTGSNDWGDRLRGKWMKETITDTQPRQDYCISHIITKFRQSYS